MDFDSYALTSCVMTPAGVERSGLTIPGVPMGGKKGLRQQQMQHNAASAIRAGCPFHAFAPVLPE
jgi:hypothetical protein